MAREVASRDGVSRGPIRLITAVEVCRSYGVRTDPPNDHWERCHAYRKCPHPYHYQVHPRRGFMHTRLQTRLAFKLRVNVNGRGWLGRQLDEAGIGYRRHENCFTQVQDLSAARGFLDERATADWAELPGPVAGAANPARRSIVGPYQMDQMD